MRLNEFSKISQILAKEHKITIQEGASWAANIQNREVYYRKDDIYNLPEDHILGLLLHEIAHIHYTSSVTMPKEHPELTHATLNMLEDIAIEDIISGDYPNAGEILDSTRTECFDTLIKILPKMKTNVFEKSLLYGAARFEDRGYASGFQPYEKLGEKISQLMLKEKTKIYGRKTTKDLLPIAKKIVDLIIKEAGKPTEQEKNQLQDAPMHGHAYEDSQQSHSKKQVITELKTSQGWHKGPTIDHQVSFVDEIIDQASMIGRQLRSVLKRNNAMEFEGRYHSGKLMTKRFVRVKVQHDRKPFARRIIKSNQSYAFAIASDVSGSMFGLGKPDRGSYAISAMYMVGEALRYAGIPRSMIVFGAYAKIASPMNKAQIPWADLANTNIIQEADQGGTDIAAAIETCTTQLQKIRAERKIMIILTDGSSDFGPLKQAHAIAIKKGIECLSISIGTIGHMEKVFKEKNIHIDNSKDTKLIGKAFINILKTSITKSQIHTQ